MHVTLLRRTLVTNKYFLAKGQHPNIQKTFNNANALTKKCPMFA